MYLQNVYFNSHNTFMDKPKFLHDTKTYFDTFVEDGQFLFQSELTRRTMYNVAQDLAHVMRLFLSIENRQGTRTWRQWIERISQATSLQKDYHWELFELLGFIKRLEWTRFRYFDWDIASRGSFVVSIVFRNPRRERNENEFIELMTNPNAYFEIFQTVCQLFPCTVVRYRLYYICRFNPMPTGLSTLWERHVVKLVHHQMMWGFAWRAMEWDLLVVNWTWDKCMRRHVSRLINDACFCDYGLFDLVDVYITPYLLSK